MIIRFQVVLAFLAALQSPCTVFSAELISNALHITWEHPYLTIRGDFPGDEIQTYYMEAYCRAGSTERDWKETVIPHKTEKIFASKDGRIVKLRDRLNDGVIIDHTITAGTDEIDFSIIAHNPTEKQSQVHWAQPCTRVDQFTGCGRKDMRSLVPNYARKCFIFLDGELTRLPTDPWASNARYTPGQVYCPLHVNRNDVNPRPLSQLVPSTGLIGCFSADEKKILALAYEPYQELFQGVIACIHNDWRLGGLKPGETKKVRGKMYLVDADVETLVTRYESDFPEHKQQP